MIPESLIAAKNHGQDGPDDAREATNYAKHQIKRVYVPSKLVHFPILPIFNDYQCRIWVLGRENTFEELIDLVSVIMRA